MPPPKLKVSKSVTHGTLQAFYPNGKKTLYIHADDLNAATATDLHHLARIVEPLLLKPTAIFEGLRPGQQKGLCYVGAPEFSWSSGKAAPPHKGKVFIVCANAEGYIYEWRWDVADPDNGNLPEDHGTRFATRIF